MSRSQFFTSIDWNGSITNIECQWVGHKEVKKPLIIFLHEGLGSLSMWKSFPEKLCTHLGVRGLVYSRPGYGKSTVRALDDPLGVDFMHRQAYEVLPLLISALKIEVSKTPVWLLGHSDGGSIALLYAAKYPNNCAGLVVLAPHIMVEDITINSIKKVRTAYQETSLNEKLSLYHKNIDSTFWGWVDIWLHPDFLYWSIESELKKITCPILAVQGSLDQYGSLKQIKTIKNRLLDRVKLIELTDCGHSPHQEQSERLISIITELIDCHIYEEKV
jgi:pimeloyl-ACP methyl ester carboxylesterase